MCVPIQNLRIRIFFALVPISKHWPNESHNQIVWKIKIEDTVPKFEQKFANT